ncbi:aquaporin-like [Tribolium madens]|uniref:aquaporin-like n=1 Tax=Tribolium madens TaxID=41895 RepID=UPI001CF743BF|nr:aquaporin-like [Tribolium madens]
MNFKFWQKFKIKDDLTALDRLTLGLAEFFGTAILMFVGCLGCAHYASSPAIPRPLFQSGIAFGFSILMAIQCFGHISGCHINPIITLGAFIVGVLPLIEVPVYLIGQFLGSFAGFGLVRLLLLDDYIFGNVPGAKQAGICAVGLNSDLTPLQGLFVEVLISFILVTIACSVWDERNENNSESVSMKFGFGVASIVIAAGPYTAAHMNPARTLGPAVLNGYWDYHWIFWVGPLTGCLLASLLYSILYSKDSKTS